MRFEVYCSNIVETRTEAGGVRYLVSFEPRRPLPDARELADGVAIPTPPWFSMSLADVAGICEGASYVLNIDDPEAVTCDGPTENKAHAVEILRDSV